MNGFQEIENLEELIGKIPDLEKDLESPKKRIKNTQVLLQVVIVVIAFISFIIDAFLFHFDEKKRLYDKVQQLENENRNKYIQQIQEQLNDIKNLLNQHASDTTKHK